MKRIYLALFVVLLYLASLLIFFSTYIRKDIREFEQLKLSYAIDYASDAAVLQLIQSRDLSMDYSDKDYLSADPKQALDTFVDVFLFNYGLTPSKMNRAHVKMNFIPTFTVAMFDGYYMATPRLIENADPYPENGINDGTWGLVFTPKMPYLYEEGGSSYALNMGGEHTLKMSGNLLSKPKGFPPGITSKEQIHREISNIVSKDISYTINTFNENNPDWANTFYIPSALTTFTGVNPIEGPSVIAIVQNVDFATSTPISAFSVAGSKIQSARIVGGYVRNGHKYYCYVDKLPASITIDDLFETVQDAAVAGYEHDMRYME